MGQALLNLLQDQDSNMVSLDAADLPCEELGVL